MRVTMHSLPKERSWSGAAGGSPVGICGSCGGVVSYPRVWHGVQRPPATCESCGRQAANPHNLPTLPMKPTVASQIELLRRKAASLDGEALNHQDKGRVRQALDAVEHAAKLRAQIRRYES